MMGTTFSVSIGMHILYSKWRGFLTTLKNGLKQRTLLAYARLPSPKQDFCLEVCLLLDVCHGGSAIYHFTKALK